MQLAGGLPAISYGKDVADRRIERFHWFDPSHCALFQLTNHIEIWGNSAIKNRSNLKNEQQLNATGATTPNLISMLLLIPISIPIASHDDE